MRHFWGLPAILRPALVLASQHTFSVQDDLLAFPQYEVHFSEDYVSEEQARLHVKSSGQLNDEERSEIEQYIGRSSHATDEDDGATKEEKRQYEMMIHHKQRYLCSIPQVENHIEQANENDTLSKAEQEKELARANDRGWELLAGMQGNCIYYMHGWWSYRFCYNQDVKQFHQLPPSRGMPVYPPIEDPSAQGYLLGRYDEKKVKHDVQAQSEQKWEGEGALEVSEHATRKVGGHGELVTRGESRYLVQKLEGGTECDLTGKERKIEVQVRCAVCASSANNLLTSILTVPLQSFNRFRSHHPHQGNSHLRLPHGSRDSTPLPRRRVPTTPER
jgi:protein OS-9